MKITLQCEPLHYKSVTELNNKVGHTHKGRYLGTEGASCLQPKPMKVRKGKPAGGSVTELLSMFTCQVSMVSQIAVPVFSARLRLGKQTSKATALC